MGRQGPLLKTCRKTTRSMLDVTDLTEVNAGAGNWFHRT